MGRYLVAKIIMPAGGALINRQFSSTNRWQAWQAETFHPRDDKDSDVSSATEYT